MSTSGFQATWVTPSGPMRCSGCEMGDIQPARRALRFLGGPGRSKRLSGLWFHGWACLARAAERLTVDEERYGPDAVETYQQLIHWAREQDRLGRRGA